MKHNSFKKVLAVFMAVLMMATGCAVYASAQCSHSSYTWQTVTQPDCKNETNGLEQKICDVCSEVLEENVLEWEYSHDFSAKSWDVYPTCTVKGEYHEKCSKCGKLSSFTVLTGTAHDRVVDGIDESTVNWFTDTPATCTEPGLKHAVCKTCGNTVASRPIDPLGHKSEMYEDWLDSTNDAEDYIGCKNVTYAAPTCTDAGSIKFLCDICAEPVRVFELDPLGHKSAALEAWDYCFATDPDFGTDEDLIQYTSWNDVDYTPATCTEPGLVTFKCNTCQTVMRTMTLEPLGHSSAAYDDYLSSSNDPEDYIGRPNVIYKAATCTETGSVTFRCDACKVEIMTFEIAALGHTEGYKKTITQATCTTAGEMGTFCATCDKLMKTEPIEALGHDYGTWYKNGDHSTHSRACSRCMYKETANCEYNETVTNPTCTEGGFTTYDCPICKDKYKDDFTDPLGHDFGAWTDDGNGETHSRTCSRCPEKESAEHSFGEWEYDHDAKFFKNGTKSKTCADCGCVVTEKAKFTAWIWHVFYPIMLWAGNIVHKSVFIGSLAWFLPWLNITPKM